MSNKKNSSNHFGCKVFSCTDQLKAHLRKEGCFNWSSPVNFIWFGLPTSAFISKETDNLLVFCSGATNQAIFGALDQLPLLYFNQKKSIRKNAMLSLVYETLVKQNGLFLMLLSREIVTGEASLLECQAKARASSTAATEMVKASGKLFESFLENYETPKLSELQERCAKEMAFNRKHNFMLRFLEDDIEKLIKNHPGCESDPFYFAKAHFSKERTFALLEFLEELNDKYLTAFFTQFNPRDEDLACIKLNPNSLKENLRALKLVVGGHIKDPKQEAAILAKLNLERK